MRKLLWISLAVSILFLAGYVLNKKDTLSEAAGQYLRQTQVDPMFAWPGVNLADMDIAIETLKKSRGEIVALAGKQYSSNITDRVQRVLYPTQYLHEMGKLENLRRKLSKNAAFTDLQAYQAQLALTIRSYQDYLDMLIPILEKTAKEQDYKGLQYHFGQSSFKHFLSVLHRYRSDLDDMLQKASLRWDCVENTTTECINPTWPVLGEVPRVPIDAESFNSETAHITSSVRMNSKLYGNPDHPNWAVTTSHRCFAKHGQAYYFLWELDLGEGVPIWKADVVNDVLVHDHQVTDQTTNQYEIMLNKLGAKGYVYQPYTTQYACPDLAADTGLIRSMSYVYDSLKRIDWPSVEGNQLGQHEKLQKGALKITGLSYLSEPLIQNFIRDLNIFLNNHTREELSAIWGETQLQIFEEMALTYRTRTYHLSRDIMALVYANTAIGDYVNYAKWGFVDELLFIRNAPALLLGGFNPSINPNGYQHVEQHRKETSPQLQSYNELLSNKFTPEELTDILIEGTNAEYELSRLQNRLYFIRD